RDGVELQRPATPGDRARRRRPLRRDPPPRDDRRPVAGRDDPGHSELTMGTVIRMTKMHGIGNDYVYVDCRTRDLPDPPRVARAVSRRHHGIGADGLILIRPSTDADCRMEMYNADGSRAQMCGNGIRCVGKYVYDRGLTRNPLRIDTDDGVKTLTLA